MNLWEQNIGKTNYGPLTVPNCFFTAQSGGLSQLLWHSVAGSEGGLVKQDLKLLRGSGGSQRDIPKVPAPSNEMGVAES